MFVDNNKMIVMCIITIHLWIQIYDIILNLPDHPSSPLILIVLLLLAFYFDVQCFVDHFMSFCRLSFFSGKERGCRLTDTDYSVGIFKRCIANRFTIDHYYEEFEDTKEGIRIRKSKKDRQDNDLQSIHIKLKIE